ncbi:MAG TPA: NAD-dependent epimerase/dehydratase family protein [Clostridia bacterium]|nr:NAD-dependent epimerase/dehydratase family protein [Clostridia bacterium]
MRVLVIGGTGSVGKHVVRQLAYAGHEITVFHRGEHEAHFDMAVRHVHAAGEPMRALAFPAELRNPEPDVVVHMVPMGEMDARAAVEFFRGYAQRIVGVSSGDVYRAYGRLTSIEPGPLEAGPLTEESPLRTVLYPYRKMAKSEQVLEYWYEKILAERELLSTDLPCTILRLGKVYGKDSNADFSSVHPFRNHPQWRWTHVYVENVAAAIVLAAFSGQSGIFNVGEQHTPTVAERLAQLPASDVPVVENVSFNFEQDIILDTSRIRTALGYTEAVGYDEGLRRTIKGLGQESM